MHASTTRPATDTQTSTDAQGGITTAVGAEIEVGARHVEAAGADAAVDDGREAALAMFRHREGLDPDAVILAAPFPVAPVLRMPPHAWAIEVDDIEMFAVPRDPDVAQEVALFVGRWVHNPNPTGAHPSGVVVRLKPTSDDTDPARHPDTDPHDAGSRDTVRGSARVDVTALHAVQGVWRQVGRWPAAGADWPQVVAPTIATVLDHEAELRYWRARAARDAESPGREAMHRLATLRARLNTGLVEASGDSPFDRPDLVDAALRMARRGLRRAEWPVHLCQTLEDLDRAGLVRFFSTVAGGDERIRLTPCGRDRLWQACRASELAATGVLDDLIAPLPERGRRAGTDC